MKLSLMTILLLMTNTCELEREIKASGEAGCRPVQIPRGGAPIHFSSAAVERVCSVSLLQYHMMRPAVALHTVCRQTNSGSQELLVHMHT